MDHLFKRLESESSKRFNISKLVPDIIPGRDSFQYQPPYVDKIVRKETVVVNGQSFIIRRVFLKENDFYRNIGWVMCADINRCMICSKLFPRVTTRKRKLHCMICGNIVCETCLNGAVRVREFDFEYVQACANCFWGQVCSPHCAKLSCNEVTQDEISLVQNESNSISPYSKPIISQGSLIDSGNISPNQESSSDVDISCLEFEETEDEEDHSNVSSTGSSRDESQTYDEEEEEEGSEEEISETSGRNGMHLMNLLLTLAITNPHTGQMSTEEAAAYVQRRDDEYLANLAAANEQGSERYVANDCNRSDDELKSGSGGRSSAAVRSPNGDDIITAGHSLVI